MCVQSSRWYCVVSLHHHPASPQVVLNQGPDWSEACWERWLCSDRSRFWFWHGRREVLQHQVLLQPLNCNKWCSHARYDKEESCRDYVDTNNIYLHWSCILTWYWHISIFTKQKSMKHLSPNLLSYLTRVGLRTALAQVAWSRTARWLFVRFELWNFTAARCRNDFQSFEEILSLFQLFFSA